MKFILSACAVVAALIALGDFRYIQKVTEIYRFERTALENSLFTQMNDWSKRRRGNFHGLPLLDRLSIVPGTERHQMGLVLEVPLHDLPLKSDPPLVVTMTIDVDVALWGHSINLTRPCLRHARHHMGPNIQQQAKDEVLRRTIKRIFERNIFAGPEGTLDRAPAFAPAAPVATNLVDHPVTRIEVQGDAVKFVLGLVAEFQPESYRWPDPVGGKCAAA